MSELFGAIGGLVNKVATKTEDVAKRVNRTVNPLSSHFREGHSDTLSHLRTGEHEHTPGRGAAPRDVGTPSRYIQKDPPALFQSEGLSSKSALCMADEIKSVVELETTKLESERDEYKTVLNQLKQLRKEQDEAYTKSEVLMREREEELRKHIEAMEREESENQSVTVAF
jgi:hypothetical protein